MLNPPLYYLLSNRVVGRIFEHTFIVVSIRVTFVICKLLLVSMSLLPLRGDDDGECAEREEIKQ